MNRTPSNYTINNFHERLALVRQYRGYKTQAGLCNKFQISRQVWSLWELNKRIPTLEQVVDIANFLEIEMCYFLIEGAQPEEFDLSEEYLRQKQMQGITSSEKLELRLMPFTSTTVSRDIFSFLEKCSEQKGLYVVNGAEDSGVTRSFKEYFMLSEEKGVYKNESQIKEPPFLTKEEMKGMVVIDNADRLPLGILKEIINRTARKVGGSTILVGKKMKQVLESGKLAAKATTFYKLNNINIEDFRCITFKALKGLDEDLFSVLKLMTSLRLKKLYAILKKIDKAARKDKDFVLTQETLDAVLEGWGG